MQNFTALHPYKFTALLAALVLTAGCSDGQAAIQDEAQATESLPRVLTVETAGEDLTLSRSYAARTQGSKEVTVRARTQGMLQTRDYDEGQLVDAGDLLFTIEPDAYAVAVQKAKADLQRAEAERSDAQRQWERIQRLFAEGAVSQRDRDQGLANVELADANYASAEASLKEAKISLAYTQVQSPIVGIAGREQHSIGNVVNEGDTLTTLVQLDPLYVYFSVPQNDLASEYLLKQVGVRETDGLPSDSPTAQIERSSGELFDHEGVIDFISRTVDAETGTINVRAQIPNPEAEILPGQFTRVRIPDIQLPDAIAIPQRALVQSGETSIVYVVNNEGLTEMREVIVGPRIDDRFVINSGLDAGEQVIVEGLAMLRPGVEVNAEPYTGGD
ncbi:efflux RND transporter periplasmic adaptor subunit [Pseudidiomarina aestuarii]|uniref:efflux RND transporter periplasmic adaptor subunit n=1 Tax=Pseudidiomarina aestuarii TaxID=624146 RepID=UPI003A972B28